MKKLIDLLESYEMVSSLGLSNVITDNDATKYDKISDSLLKDINTAAKNSGLKVSITTAKSGHREKTKSGNKSRHTTGDAVDISIINGIRITKDLGNKLANELKKLGYDTSGNESGNNKAVLWQVADHYNHMHVSNTTGTSSNTTGTPSDTVDTQQPTANSGYQSYMSDIANSFAKGLIPTNENRLIKNIDKIKKLLK